ncbi:MAG: hypothetical protein R3236_07025 [Phycisphaeraceae bacterium]|nr:hypothetical protein [Phycisphaeraceae bacterium]
MAFTEDVRHEAFERSGGRCECCRVEHQHPAGRCSNTLHIDEAVYVPLTEDAENNTLQNCQVLCSYCHMNISAHTRTE